MYEIDGNFIIKNGYKMPLYMAEDKKYAYRIKKFDINKDGLFPYQYIGSLYLLTRKASILGDFMGLGKTAQALRSSEYLLNKDKEKFCLIVAPKGALVEQWKKEVPKFTKYDAEIIKDIDDNYEKRYIITNYEKLYKDGFEKILKRKPILILDEVSKIKNFFTLYSQALYKYSEPEYMFMLSGTVFENSPIDIWSLFKQMKNNYLEYDYYDFINKYAIIEERERLDGQTFNTIVGWKNMDELKSKIEPLILRRTFNDVSVQLPEKSVEDVYIELNKNELALYHRIERDIKTQKGDEYVLALFTFLKRFLDYPPVLEKNELTRKYDVSNIISSKANMLLEIVESLKGSKIVIFSQYSDVVQALGDLLKTRYLYYGDISNEIIDEFNKNKEGILIMTDKGAYGLNLQTATVIINYDLPWNPAVIEQRIGRIYRLGQKNKVLVLNLIINEIGLIERYISRILKEKQSLGMKLLPKVENRL